jgi:hypothetical protein
MLSDGLGRVGVMRLALMAVLVTGLLSRSRRTSQSSW